MRKEFYNIHDVLHSSQMPAPRTVCVDSIHRIIHTTKKGKRYLIYTDSDNNEWMLVAVAPHNTLITKLYFGNLTTEKYKIRKYVP